MSGSATRARSWSQTPPFWASVSPATVRRGGSRLVLKVGENAAPEEANLLCPVDHTLVPEPIERRHKATEIVMKAVPRSVITAWDFWESDVLPTANPIEAVANTTWPQHIKGAASLLSKAEISLLGVL